MPLLKEESVAVPASSYIVLHRDQNMPKDNIRVTSNHITVLDDDGELIQEVAISGRILPANIENNQINQRSLLNSVDSLVKGLNLTVLFVGSSFSGKEKIFDGDKQEFPLSYHFAERLFPILRQNFRKFELRMQMALVVKEKIYDCFSDNKYGTLKVRQNDWEGPEIQCITNVAIDNTQDFKRDLQRAIRQKNKLVLEFKDLYASVMVLTLVREGEDGNVVSTVKFVEMPGVQLLSQSHNALKHKEASLSTRSLLNFASILNEYNRNPESIPEYDSTIGGILKQSLAGNSHLVVYFTMRSEDIEGSRATIRLIKLSEGLRQYPMINSANTFGLLRKFRAEAAVRKSRAAQKEIQEDKAFLENEVTRVRSEEDYTRMLEKYSELKNKYSGALKAKSEAQLELIRCQEEKLQIGKSLVEVQIQNTKLLQKLQNKDYEHGKKALMVENKLNQRENSYQETLDKVQELSIALNEALESRRDLEVEFVALKRNFILQQKDITKLKEDNQNLSLDVVNLSNQNQQLRKDWHNRNSANDKSRMMYDLQGEKEAELKKEVKRNQQTIAYLKGEIERYRKEMVQKELNFQSKAKGSSLSGYGKDYDRLELQNENLELQNRVKILQRKIEQLEDRTAFYEEENTGLEEENQRMRQKDLNDTNEYRRRLEELTKGSNYETIVKELKDNFARKDADNLAKINASKKVESQKKRQIFSLKAYMRELMTLLEEWAPKGAEVPSIRKFKSIDLSSEGDSDEVASLRVKNLRLQEQVRRLRASGGFSNSAGGLTKGNSEFMKESRVKQEYDYLKNSIGSEGNRLREENNKLAEQNRRLTNLLKDSGNKMDLNVLRRENDQLRRELQILRSNSSVSPSTNHQKVACYEKYIKNLERERSELLSRAAVAEEQVKNLLAKMGRKGV